MTSEAGDNPFWAWSLHVYELPGVKNRLIYLQDDFGFDVNLVLWCCWRAQGGETLKEDMMRKAEQKIARWVEDVTEPLREARRNARNGPSAFYAQLKDAEIEAEHHAQNILFEFSGPITDADFNIAVTAARNNLGLYAGLIDAPRRDGYSSALLRDLIDHIFPQDQYTAGGSHS